MANFLLAVCFDWLMKQKRLKGKTNLKLAVHIHLLIVTNHFFIRLIYRKANYLTNSEIV